MKIANNALENCKTTEDVVNLINDEFATDATPEMVAAEYARTAAIEAGFGITAENVEMHLDFLIEFGAKFNWEAAIRIALRTV